MPPTAVLRELSPASLVGWGETETSLTTPFGGDPARTRSARNHPLGGSTD
jgi:hypothetical protein